MADIAKKKKKGLTLHNMAVKGESQSQIGPYLDLLTCRGRFDICSSDVEDQNQADWEKIKVRGSQLAACRPNPAHQLVKFDPLITCAIYRKYRYVNWVT